MSFSSNAPGEPATGPERKLARLEARLQKTAQEFPYPPTPALAARERQRLAGSGRARPARVGRRLSTGLALLCILLAAALLVSPVRARVLEWIRIGSVRIFLTQPSATPPAPATPPAHTGTPAPEPSLLQSVLDLDGEMSLAQAQEQAGYPIHLPEFPADLGSPEHVYLQDMNTPVVVLVWMDPERPGTVRMSLSESATSGLVFEKYALKSVQETQVAGNAAVWIDGEYILITRSGEVTMTRLMTQSHTLIWSTGERTYRLETDLDLETALQIAESIR